MRFGLSGFGAHARKGADSILGQKYKRVKPSLLEGGLPCTSLSAECQRDNNARQRPPQNRLHIWWARRPPTVCRAAVLSALIPFDIDFDQSVLPDQVDEVSRADLDSLPRKFDEHRAFFEGLISRTGPTPLTGPQASFLASLGVRGDAARAYRRMAMREEYLIAGSPIMLPQEWTYRHPPAFAVSPSSALLSSLLDATRTLLSEKPGQPVVVLDPMAGGGAISLEALRYGFKVFSNDLNPVAAIVQKATLEYPSIYGRRLLDSISPYVQTIASEVRRRLLPLFPAEPAFRWWEEEHEAICRKFTSKAVLRLDPSERDSTKNCYLWLHTVPCPKCGLEIPLSTNFTVVSKKGKPEDSIAVFPLVPSRAEGDTCTFRIVKRSEWQECRWPRPGFDKWDPRGTPTFKDGSAICPRCGHVIDGDEVKAFAQRSGGLPSQMYAICSQVPVKVTYRNGDVKTRYLWRFRAPANVDLDAVTAAGKELARLAPQWQAMGLIPDEEIPEDMEDKRPREYGMKQWRDFFLPRQLLTNMVVLEEILKAQALAKKDLLEAEAEAVSVYLSFMLSKVVNYNSVNTFWHYGRKTVAQTFSRHDFAFRPAFCEFEGARETVDWAASQVLNAYEELARLIHGEPVELTEADEDAEVEEGEEADEETPGEIDNARPTPSAVREEIRLRPEVIVPTVTCEDAAALSDPAPGTVHLVCVDPPYYNNVQYSELSNFFYVWLKRALGGWPGLGHLFRETLAETGREAVANAARWQREANAETADWQARVEQETSPLKEAGMRAAEARKRALELCAPKPETASERASRFYEDKMTACFRRARQLLHPAGRMVVMFNHKETAAWRSLGTALIQAGFEIRSSAPIHTEAESSLNIRGLDAARSTVLLLCLPREQREQPVGNWLPVKNHIPEVARNAAKRFEAQGLAGSDLYLSSLGPVLGEVARNWPVTDYRGRAVDLLDALNEAYGAVGRWRLEQILESMIKETDFRDVADVLSPDTVDRSTQTLWLWLDANMGEVAHSDEVRKLAKSLNVEPNEFLTMGLLRKDKEAFVLLPPSDVDLRRVSLRLQRSTPSSPRDSRGVDVWEERVFPEFMGAAVWNAISLMGGADNSGRESVIQWLRSSGYGNQREFRGVFAVTLRLLEAAFGRRPEGDPWGETCRLARKVWDLVLRSWG